VIEGLNKEYQQEKSSTGVKKDSTAAKR
jgi:hypothetical protein